MVVAAANEQDWHINKILLSQPPITVLSSRGALDLRSNASICSLSALFSPKRRQEPSPHRLEVVLGPDLSNSAQCHLYWSLN